MSIEITSALLNGLRQKAEKVEPNDYVLSDGCVIKSESFKDLTIADCAFSDDAEFIAAASPAVVLALIDEVERLRSFQAVAVEVIDKLNIYHECYDSDQCRSCEQINAGIEAISKAKREASDANQA